jgi:thiol:disulfide interchange protein DsbD
MEAFKAKGVVLVKADWTNYDERITSALAGYGKNSIPLYVLYGPQPGQEPVILPEILTPKIVLQALGSI